MPLILAWLCYLIQHSISKVHYLMGCFWILLRLNIGKGWKYSGMLYTAAFYLFARSGHLGSFLFRTPRMMAHDTVGCRAIAVWTLLGVFQTQGYKWKCSLQILLGVRQGSFSPSWVWEDAHCLGLNALENFLLLLHLRISEIFSLRLLGISFFSLFLFFFL